MTVLLWIVSGGLAALSPVTVLVGLRIAHLDRKGAKHE